MGLRTRLLLLVLVPVIPALVFAVFSSLEQQRFGRFKVERDAIQVVQTASTRQAALIEAARQNLAALSRIPEGRSNNIPEFDEFFTKYIRIYTNYTDFGLAEKDGTLISSSFGRIGLTNIGHQAHIQRVGKTLGFAIGTYQPEDAVRKPSLAFGHPIFDENGRHIRVVYAALSLARVGREAAAVQLPKGGVIHVFDSDGRVLASQPDAERWVGKSVSDSPLMTTILERTEGTREVAGLDGVSRLYAFMPIRSGEAPALFLSVGIPTSTAFAGIKARLARHLIILGLIAVLVLLVANVYASWYILQPIRALVNATHRLASGDLSARSGIGHSSGELNRLAQAFDEMAESVQCQRSEIERSERALRNSEEQIRALNANLERRVVERTRELESANKELESFSYSVSHDLRAPLRRIDGFIEILRQDASTKLGESGQSCLETVSRSARQMGRLIDDLLAFSRTGRIELRRESVDLDQLVAEVIAEISREVPGRNIEWKVGPLPEVTVDQSMLQQVWVNLLANAVKYTRKRERAEIVIQCRENSRNEFEFSVRDNGVGFDMKYVHKLFGVFERLHNDKEFEGTGIGLANVQRIISRHGGRTWAEGELDAGATFYFTVPRDAR